MSHLQELRINEIEKTIDKIKLDTGLSYPENNLVDIIRALGADVVSQDLPSFKGKKVKGYIKWFTTDTELENEKPYTAKIYLNKQEKETTQTFTLAHELGHLLLHKNSNNFRLDLQDYSLGADPKNQETEANYFAGELLMPKDKFFTVLVQSKSLSDVAKIFGTSIPAVEARIKWLNIKMLEAQEEE